MMFMTGLMGGFGHCIGMCGPAVTAYSMGLGERKAAAHLLYSLGRITTYGILGGMVGLTGSFLGIAKSLERLQVAAVALVGCAMIVMGISVIGWRGFVTGPAPAFGGRLSALVFKAMKIVSESRGLGMYYPMGLVLGFIPCGLLYTVLIAAAGAGAAASGPVEGFLGGLVMLLLFGLGTTPALFMLGQLSSALSAKLRGRLYKAAGVMMIVTGVIYINRSFQ